MNGDRKFDEFCDSKEIFYIDDVDGYYMINGSEGFRKSDWTIEEAVEYYKSDKGKADRFDSWYRTWCD